MLLIVPARVIATPASITSEAEVCAYVIQDRYEQLLFGLQQPGVIAVAHDLLDILQPHDIAHSPGSVLRFRVIAARDLRTNPIAEIGRLFAGGPVVVKPLA